MLRTRDRLRYEEFWMSNELTQDESVGRQENASFKELFKEKKEKQLSIKKQTLHFNFLDKQQTDNE